MIIEIVSCVFFSHMELYLQLAPLLFPSHASAVSFLFHQPYWNFNRSSVRVGHRYIFNFFGFKYLVLCIIWIYIDNLHLRGHKDLNSLSLVFLYILSLIFLLRSSVIIFALTGQQDSVRSRALTEEHARDSFENLLFSVCRFRELTGTYPQNITVSFFLFCNSHFFSSI